MFDAIWRRPGFQLPLEYLVIDVRIKIIIISTGIQCQCHKAPTLRAPDLASMPHKRAKRSVREQSRKEKGADLAPGKQALSTEAIPKSVSRVLDAARIRGAWSDKKRKLMEDGEPQRNDKRRKLGDEHGRAREGAKKGRTKVGTSSEIRIKPGESIQHFNRRVEDDMRPLVKSAMQSSLAVSRNARKTEVMAKNDKKNGGKGSSKSRNVTPPIRQPSPSPPPKHADRPKEFETLSSSAPRRLNDIAQAPPEFKSFPAERPPQPRVAANEMVWYQWRRN
ncbi:hypothetical protein BD779DRAFT_214913 [Infundibulicybe gibba]|nr:hypothetical protein BD779DRAFT_214913 [Infundibulicybe gibba]